MQMRNDVLRLIMGLRSHLESKSCQLSLQSALSSFSSKEICNTHFVFVYNGFVFVYICFCICLKQFMDLFVLNAKSHQLSLEFAMSPFPSFWP